MSADKKAIGRRLRKEREDPPRRSREKWAILLRTAAGPQARTLPSVSTLADMIKQWERGDHVPGPIYRPLYAKITGKTETELFEPTVAPKPSLWRPNGLDVTLTPDEEGRVALVTANPVRLDVRTLDALAAVLAAQRRLEDTVGPAALLRPVTSQLDAISSMLRAASGPLRVRLGRIAAEWTVYTGWLHAAVRQDRTAFAFFGLGEDLADEFADGTIAAVATSFRGYVARQRGNPRGVIRASSAALASPGGHPVQRIFDQLQAAQGYATLGETDQARRLLDTAAEKAADRIEPPPPVYWYSEPFFQLNIGMVNRDIGEYSKAATLLDAGLRNMPTEQLGAEWLVEYKAVLSEAQNRA